MFLFSLVRFKCTAASEETRQEPCQADSMLDIGTRRIFSEEHDMFRRTVRKFFQEHVVPYHSQYVNFFYLIYTVLNEIFSHLYYQKQKNLFFYLKIIKN